MGAGPQSCDAGAVDVLQACRAEPQHVGEGLVVAYPLVGLSYLQGALAFGEALETCVLKSLK